MELRQALAIFAQYRVLFIATLLVPSLLVIFHGTTRPVSYEGVMTFVVTRTSDATLANDANASVSDGLPDYDAFYQVSTDEKVADSLVTWLGTPSVVQTILAGGAQTLQIDQLENYFTVQKQAPQIVSVRYEVSTQEQSRAIAESLVAQADRLSVVLSPVSDSVAAYVFVPEDVVVRQVMYPWYLMLFTALVVGFGSAVLAVLLRHYLR